MAGAHRPDPVSTRRRRVVAALGALGAGGLLGACATVPPPRPVDRARAPRVGDSWRYAYRSAWKQDPPRMLDCTVVAVTDQAVTDRLTIDGAVSPSDERTFGSGFALTPRVFPGLVVQEFSPYVFAFGDLAPGVYAASMPREQFGSAWSGTARVLGAEQVITAAGAFAATRVQFNGGRPFLSGMDDAADATQIFATAWYAAAVRRIVKLDFLSQAARLNPIVRDHYELVGYRAS